MKYSSGHHSGKYLLLLCLLLCGRIVFAQPNTLTNAPKKDTSKTNTGKWKDENARISYEKLNSARRYVPDTGLHTFQRNPFTQPWYRDMGNLGSPVNNLLFTPEDHIGPGLGYHIFDVYRFDVDSLNFYSTNRPYSVFSYQLGSKLEQYASILHTQNIKPNWNFAVQYRKINSPGYYKIQRNNHDNASLSTNFKSLDKHYVLYAAMAYNKEQHDENGGIINDSELINPSYNDRKTVDAAYQNSQYSISRSSVFNVQRDFTLLLQHSYTWGNTDTTYNADSTQYSYHLKPLFSITHKMEISTEKHTYKDLTPDSLRYITLFNQSFTNNGSGYYTPGEDSVFVQQKWFWVDNKLLLNGFIGKEGKQLTFSAGIGNRYDQFISQPVGNIIHDTVHIGLDRSSMVSNYLAGEIKKEALTPNAWEYGANTKFFFTGQDAGNFLLNAMIGKQLKNNIGSFLAGFQEQVGSAPYSYTNYENQYTKLFTGFNNESTTALYATIESPRLRLSGGIRDYVINNYIYINDSETPAQYTIPFTILQVWGRKVFKAGNFYLDNELVYQQLPVNAPVNVPALMGRHQFSYESNLFKRALKLVTGIEVRYNTSYYPAGYDALLNKFFYQHSQYISNAPEMAVFLNFRVKKFRAFVMGDNLQQLFAHNTILYTGTPVVNFNNNIGYNIFPVYAAPDIMIRFGFSWVMVN
ncbi:MAG: putative porin [Chitinophagales bacterium]